MADDDALSDEELLRRARARVVRLMVVFGVLVLVLGAAVVLGVARSSGNYQPGTARWLTGDALLVVGAAAAVASSLRFLRVIRQQPAMPPSTAAQRLRALRCIRRGVPPREAEPARALAARMAAGRLRALGVVSVAPMLVGAAILLPGPLLGSALVAFAVLLVLLAIPLIRSAGRAERFLAATDVTRSE